MSLFSCESPNVYNLPKNIQKVMRKMIAEDWFDLEILKQLDLEPTNEELIKWLENYAIDSGKLEALELAHFVSCLPTTYANHPMVTSYTDQISICIEN